MTDKTILGQSICQSMPLGYAIPAGIADEQELQNLGQLAHEVLQDPIKMQRLSESILHYLRQDMTYQWERGGFGVGYHQGYGRQF
jgi:hypothetical protein